jgi:hypothetical protein
MAETESRQVLNLKLNPLKVMIIGRNALV